MRRLSLLTGLAVVVVACSTGDYGAQRPEPDQLPSGVEVAQLTIEDTRFVLYDDGGDCASLWLDHPGLQTTVDSGCFDESNVLLSSSPCGWLEEPVEGAIDCDLVLPAVHWGKVTDPGIGFVCLGIQDGDGATGVTGARFIDFDDAGYVLVESLTNEHDRPHLFTMDGAIYGDPPYDAPSAPTYEFCRQLAPWGDPPIVYDLLVHVEIDEAIRSDDVTVFLGTGTGTQGFIGSASESGVVVLSFETTGLSAGLDFELQADGFGGSRRIAWPSEVQELLDSGLACASPIEIRMKIGRSGVEGPIEISSLDC